MDIASKALTFEGDTDAVLTALVNDAPVQYVHGGGGMAGAAAAAVAPALEALDLRANVPVVGRAVSVGVVNQLLIAYRLGQRQVECYWRNFCSDRFVKPGIKPWFDGSKVNLHYFEAVLLEKLQEATAHPDSEVRVGVTNWESGEYVELTADLADTRRVAKLATASAWLPCIGRGYKVIDGTAYTDGGVANQLPLPPNLKPSDPPILIVLASGDELSRTQRIVERQIFKRAPPHIAELVHGRKEQVRAKKAFFRAQLAMPIGHPQRTLPPTCIVEPLKLLKVVEQRIDVLQAALGETYLSMYQLLNNHIAKLAA